MGRWCLAKVEGMAPAPRGAHAMVSVGSKVIVFGGADRTPTAFADLWVLDTGCDPLNWMHISPQIEPGCALNPRSGATLTVVGDFVYLFGGQDPVSGTCFNDVKRLDIQTWAWSGVKVEGTSPPPRHSHCTGCLASACLLVYGGAGMQGGPLGDAWMFNVTAASWSSLQAKGSAPPPREMHSGTMVDDSRMLVFGGRGTDNRVLCDAALLNARESRWELVEPTPFSRCAHSGVALPNQPAQQAQPLAEHAAVDGPLPSPDASDAAPSTSSSSGGSSGSCSAVLIYGGYSGEAVEGDVLKIDPLTLEIDVLRRGPRGSDRSAMPAARFAHSAVAIRNPSAAACGPETSRQTPAVCMVVFGGVNPKEDLNDIAVWVDDGLPTPPTPAPAEAARGLPAAAMEGLAAS